MTFSIAARCPKTGMFGIAVASSSPAVAARCAHARAGAGAVGSQNVTDPRLGMLGLDLLETGSSATDALAALLRHGGDMIAWRQLILVDSQGHTAVFSGARTLGTHASSQGPGVVAAGNLLANSLVPERMRDAFLASENAAFGERLVRSMRAGLDAGGEVGPIKSIGLKVVRELAWPIADLRVDWDETDPIGELERLWALWQPQMDDYVRRALDPARAPSFGVPGER
jgi:uncharacterized Ntn-hydrolase superfamily protein